MTSFFTLTNANLNHCHTVGKSSLYKIPTHPQDQQSIKKGNLSLHSHKTGVKYSLNLVCQSHN